MKLTKNLGLSIFFVGKTSEKIWKNFGKGLEKIRIFSNEDEFFPTFFQTFSDLFPEKIGWNGKESGKNPEKIQKKFGKSLEKIRKKFGKNPTKFVLKIREDFKQKLQYWVANRKILYKNSSTHFLTGIIIHLTSTENQPQYKID